MSGMSVGACYTDLKHILYLSSVNLISGAKVSRFLARAVFRRDNLLGFILSRELDLGHCRHVLRRVAEESGGRRAS